MMLVVLCTRFRLEVFEGIPKIVLVKCDEHEGPGSKHFGIFKQPSGFLLSTMTRTSKLSVTLVRGMRLRTSIHQTFTPVATYSSIFSVITASASSLILELDQPFRMAHIYAGNDTSIDEGSRTGNNGSHNLVSCGTMKIPIIMVSGNSFLKPDAEIIEHGRALNAWLRSSENTFNFHQNDILELNANTVLYGDMDTILPTDYVLEGAHTLILAGPIDAADEFEILNKSLREYVKGNTARQW